MCEEDNEQTFLFKPVQNLGLQVELPVPVEGTVNAATSFVVPELTIAEKELDKFRALGRNLGYDISRVDLSKVTNQSTKAPATMVTMCFEVPANASDEGEVIERCQSISFLLTERFLGLLSYCGGGRLTAVHRQFYWRQHSGGIKQVLRPMSRTEPTQNHFELPNRLTEELVISDKVFSAFYWLRRGIGETDPVESFSALMVSIQILARELVQTSKRDIVCPKCKELLEQRSSGDTELVRRLLTETLKVPEETAKKLWVLRNAVVAHGGRAVSAEVIGELTESKFDAAEIAFRAVGLALGLEEESCPRPNALFFATDAFMNIR